MSTTNDAADTPTPISAKAVLVLPHLRVQNANAISSPLTWGFPSITAFSGLMTALARRLGPDAGLSFQSVGVVCHGFEAQVTQAGYTRAFKLTRNPVLADGSTAAIVEEGRVHLDLTLVLDVELAAEHRGDAQRQALADSVADALAGMRLAGGSVMPPLPSARRRPSRPTLELQPSEPEDARKQFRRLARRWMPGYALVSRDDLLQDRLAELRTSMPGATALDAWLDLSRLTHRAVQLPTETEGGDAKTDGGDAKTAGGDAKAEGTATGTAWQIDPRPGWIVPIPVGYAALSALHPAGTVAGARDGHTPFRFVESVWSIGQWISPHRLGKLADLFWVADHADNSTLYRCRNAYTPAPAQAPESAANPASAALATQD